MTGKTWTWTVTPTGATASVPVLDGSISVDATRNPQVEARLVVPFSTWTEAKRFDPYTRSEVIVEVRTTTHVGGTMKTFGQDSTPGTLATLDWSSKADNASPLTDATTPRIETRRLRLFVTDFSVDEVAGTLDVTLASADFLLTELVNFGPDWMPRPGPSAVQWSLDDVWGEFLRVFGLPMWLDPVQADPGINFAWRYTMDPWETGAGAWSWLNAVRTEVPGWRYVLDTETGQLTFLQGLGEVNAPATIRNGATSVTSRRSIETSAEGVNQYADAYAIRWVDRTGQNRPQQWEFANAYGDWRLMRRAAIEERDMPRSTSPVSTLAESRLDRSRKFQRLVTVTHPIARVTGPFRDLSDHPMRTSVQSIAYDYASGDVITTYLEGDS